MNITFNGKEYDTENLPDKVGYMVKQIRFINDDITKLQFELDQKKAAMNYFQDKVSSFLEAAEGIDGNTNQQD